MDVWDDFSSILATPMHYFDFFFFSNFSFLILVVRVDTFSEEDRESILF